MSRLNWKKLLIGKRLSDIGEKAGKKIRRPNKPKWLIESRTEIERDYDRILFSTPVRRLADKTQVFPLERNASIRTRLTHSHEVSNLARSIGTYLANSSKIGGTLKSELGESASRDIPAMLAAAGLAHDLGNPPFGHQGEEAIRSWVKKNEAKLFFERNSEEMAGFSCKMEKDFRIYEGNAQTLRTVSSLQVVDNMYGLNLTFGTLAAIMKYTVPAHKVDKTLGAASKKPGFFLSETSLVEKIRQQTGLSEGTRHPLTFIMEACDDLAYSVLDAEDSVKKQLVSFSDLIAWLKSDRDLKKDELTQWVIKNSELDHVTHRSLSLSPAELNDVSMQKFRVYAIHGMVSSIVKAFESQYDDIMQGQFQKSLIDISDASALCRGLKKFDYAHGYRNRDVLAIELEGYNVLHGLMDMLWRGIIERVDPNKLDSVRSTPFAAYAYERISENYRRIFEGSVGPKYESKLPIRYRELQLLTDMISGMTDNFAVELYEELGQFHVGASLPTSD